MAIQILHILDLTRSSPCMQAKYPLPVILLQAYNTVGLHQTNLLEMVPSLDQIPFWSCGATNNYCNHNMHVPQFNTRHLYGHHDSTVVVCISDCAVVTFSADKPIIMELMDSSQLLQKESQVRFTYVPCCSYKYVYIVRLQFIY